MSDPADSELAVLTRDEEGLIADLRANARGGDPRPRVDHEMLDDLFARMRLDYPIG